MCCAWYEKITVYTIETEINIEQEVTTANQLKKQVYKYLLRHRLDPSNLKLVGMSKYSDARAMEYAP